MYLKFYKPIFGLMVLLFCGGSTLFAQSKLSLNEQVQLVLQEKNARTPTERKIDSRLLQAVREKRGQKMVNGLNLEPVDLHADASGYVKVDIYCKVSEAILAKIEQANGKIIFPSWEYNKITALVNLAAIESLAGVAEIRFIEPSAEATTVGNQQPDVNKTISDVDGKITPASTQPAKEFFSFLPTQKLTFEQRAARVKAQLTQYMQQYNSNGFVGNVTSQADRVHRADDAKNTYGFEGQGIRIGVLSDSYNRLGAAATDVLNGELPGVGNPFGNTTPVTVLQDFATGADEGRAMLQLIHDIAPKAQLYYATAFVSDASFASNITALRNAPNNCDIIIDDVSYFNEPVFQDGIIAQAVIGVTTSGGMYFSSASNSGSVAKNTAGYFEGDFNDAGSPVFTFPGGTKAGTIHNFGTVGAPVNGDILTLRGSVYNLYWSDPANVSTNDYDLFLISSAGTIKAQSTNIQSGTLSPYEAVAGPATLAAGDRLVVFKTATAAVRAFAINANRGALTVVTTGQTHGHNSTDDAFGVAATPAQDPFSATTPAGPFPGVFQALNQVESFSSDGYRRIFYTPAGAEITPGNVLIGTNGGVVRNKPDITAADGTLTTVSGFSSFYGTSAAAPNAGAIAALLKSSNPSLTPAQIRTAMVSTALDIEAAGFDRNSGAGIVQAFQAMQFLNPTGIANVNIGTTTVSEVTTASNNNGNVDPGENGMIVAQITDPSLTTATAVSAVLSTTTTGITITQNTANYGTLTAGSSALNTATPYIFSVAGTVPCGTTINFYLTVNFSGGAGPKTFLFTKKVGSPATTISSTLGGIPPAGANYSVTSGQQTGRIARSGVSSTCAAPKAAPGLTVTTGARQYDAYTFTNTSTNSQCVTVNLAAANGINLYVATYNNAGFVPSNPNTNYLADPGSSSNSISYSFNAPAGQGFTIVVHDINVTPASNSPYTITLDLAACNNFVLPVTWLDFTAVEKNDQVYLDWKVANEINVARYEVEYSVDGNSFNSLSSVAALTNNANEKAYSKIHAFPVAGMNYYRIKQIDKDGRSTYSKTVSIKLGNKNIVTVSPNPASDFVVIQSRVTMTHVQLYTAAGQLVADVKPIGNMHKLPLANLPSGQYFVRIQTADGFTNKKITKE